MHLSEWFNRGEWTNSMQSSWFYSTADRWHKREQIISVQKQENRCIDIRITVLNWLRKLTLNHRLPCSPYQFEADEGPFIWECNKYRALQLRQGSQTNYNINSRSRWHYSVILSGYDPSRISTWPWPLFQIEECCEASAQAQISVAITNTTTTSPELHVQQEARHAKDARRYKFQREQGVQSI